MLRGHLGIPDASYPCAPPCTHFPGLSSSPPAGHWQHRRMYSCSASWSNIQCAMLSAGSPGRETQRRNTREGVKSLEMPFWRQRKPVATHPWHGVPDGAGAGAQLAKRSSTHPPACCSGPGIRPRSASAARSPSAAGDRNQCGTKDPQQDETTSIPEKSHSPAGSGGSGGAPA